MNLSIEIWSSSVVLAEINEEVEQVIEDPVINDALMLEEHSAPFSSQLWLADYRNHHLNEYSRGCDFFEIDSPPPDIG